MACEPTSRPAGVRTIFRLPATIEEYWSSLPGKERANARRRLRLLEKLGPITVDVVADPARVEAEFEAFSRHHADQWRAAGLEGHFGSWPRGEEFHRELVRRQGRLGRVQFHRICVDGALRANRYTYIWGNTLFSELPSRAVGEPWDKLGLGGTAYVKMFESAIAVGLERIDSGLGSYDNKVQLGGEEVAVCTWRVLARRWPGRWRARAFLTFSAAVRLVFDKLWYRRVLRRLPRRFKRTQCLGWLRFDA